MAGPVEAELKALYDEIRNSKMDKDQALIFLEKAVESMIRGLEGKEGRWGASMAIGGYIKIMRSGGWKKLVEKE